MSVAKVRMHKWMCCKTKKKNRFRNEEISNDLGVAPTKLKKILKMV